MTTYEEEQEDKELAISLIEEVIKLYRKERVRRDSVISFIKNMMSEVVK